LAPPLPSVLPPSLGSYGFSYSGTAFGGTVNPITTPGLTSFATLAPGGITGHDVPVVVSQDGQRNLDSGAWPGQDVYAPRTVTATLNVLSDGTSLQHALASLQTAFLTVGIVEYPLYLQMPGQSLRVVMGRCRGFTYPIDINYVQAGAAVCAVRFDCSDPRWYDCPTQNPSIGLGSPTVGAGFAVDGSGPTSAWPSTNAIMAGPFPVGFGGTSGGGTLVVTNAGNMEMRPLLVITGPCTNPTVQNTSITLPSGSSPSLTFTITLNAGDVLTVDLDAGSAMLVTSGSPATSASVKTGTMAPGSTWWNLPPGSNTITFGSADNTQATGTLQVVWANAWNAL
jgi:hypothetical protein